MGAGSGKLEMEQRRKAETLKSDGRGQRSDSTRKRAEANIQRQTLNVQRLMQTEEER
jgi:hypothetical protein